MRVAFKLADVIKKMRRARGIGVSAGGIELAEADAYSNKARPMGAKPGVDLDKARSLADLLDDEEVVRKLNRRR